MGQEADDGVTTGQLAFLPCVMRDLCYVVSYVRSFIAVSFRWSRTSEMPLGCTKTSATSNLWT
jgi:hypothetical protein